MAVTDKEAGGFHRLPASNETPGFHLSPLVSDYSVYLEESFSDYKEVQFGKCGGYLPHPFTVWLISTTVHLHFSE